MQQIPYQTPRQAKYSEQYRRMIDRFRAVRDTLGHEHPATERAWRRLLQAKAILNAANNG